MTMLKAAEAGRLMGLSQRHVYDLAAKGLLPCYRFGSAVRFDAADIDAYLQSCRSVSTPETSAGATSLTAKLAAPDSALRAYFQKAGLPSAAEIVGHHVHLGRVVAQQLCCLEDKHDPAV